MKKIIFSFPILSALLTSFAYSADIKLCSVEYLLKEVDRENVNIKALIIDHKTTFAVHYVNDGKIDMKWLVSPKMHMQPSGRFEGQDSAGMAITNGTTVYSLDSIQQGVSAIYKECKPAPESMIQELVDFDKKVRQKEQDKAAAEKAEKEKEAVDDLQRKEKMAAFFNGNMKRAKEFNSVIIDKIKNKEWIPVKVNIATIPAKYDRTFICDQVTWVATGENKWAPVNYRKRGITLKQSKSGEWVATYKPDGKLADSTVQLFMPDAGYPTVSTAIQDIGALYISTEPNAPFYQTYNCSEEYF